MFTLPGFLGFLLPLPALLKQDNAAEPKRRRAIHALHLSPHILKDAGLDDFAGAADDQRWKQRPDLER